MLYAQTLAHLARHPILVLNGGYERFSAYYHFFRTQKIIWMPQVMWTSWGRDTGLGKHSGDSQEAQRSVLDASLSGMAKGRPVARAGAGHRKFKVRWVRGDSRMEPSRRGGVHSLLEPRLRARGLQGRSTAKCMAAVGQG